MMKLFKKYMVIALCAVVIATSVLSPIKTYALSSTTASQIIDVALTKTGIVANKSILNAVEDKLVVVVRDTLKLYDAWLDENPSKEVGTESFNEFVDGGGLSTFAYRAIEPYINRKFISTLMKEYRSNLDSASIDISEAITGETSILGKIISLPSALVNFIRSLFDEYATKNSDFYYIDTYSPSDVNPLWFDSPVYYQDFCYQLNNYEGLMYIVAVDGNNVVPRTDSTTGVITKWTFKLIDNEVHFVDNDFNKYRYRIKAYDSVWVTPYQALTHESSFNQTTIQNFTIDTCTTETTVGDVSDHLDIYVSGVTEGKIGLWTNDGRPVKVYKTLEALKLATVGQSPYYVTNNANKYETTDNSVNVSGDYLISDSYTYSHDIVQTEIDNSETITNETVNNIVNNNQQTIINNYASSVTPDDGSSDNGGGLGSILDGLGSIISAIAEIVGFLLGVIGDVIGLIGDLFKTVFDGLKTIGAIVGDFPKLLGEIFVFIPQELINFLVLSIEASVGIAIWRQFSKK